jgi:hypothetical protein
MAEFARATLRDPVSPARISPAAVRIPAIR